MKISTPAIVLKTTPFKESSLIARLFTLEKGKSSYVIKSAMRQKSPLKSIYQQINEIEVNYTHNSRRQLQPIYDSKLLNGWNSICLLYTSPSPRDGLLSRMPSSA